MNDQTITVSLPYYRCREQVGRAVESILSQSYSHLRVVVVNDGDPDPPWEELKSLRDPRLVLFTLEENHGCFFAHQVVLDSTPDSWIALQDADDWSEPRRLETLFQAARAEDSDGAVSAMVHHIPFGGLTATQLERHPDLSRPPAAELEYRGCLMGLFKAEAVRSAGGFGAGFRISYDKLLFNFLLMTGRLSWVDEPLYHRMVREGSLTTSSESGIGSREWQRVNRKLQSIYARVHKRHGELCAGRISKEQFLETVRSSCEGAVSRHNREALAREAGRLRTMLSEIRTGASEYRPRTLSFMPQPRYRATALREFPFGPESSLVYSPVTHQANETPSKLLKTLAGCRQMDTLGNHALAIGRDRRIQSVFGNQAANSNSLGTRILQRLRGYSEQQRDLMRLNPVELTTAAAEVSEMVRLGLMVSEGDLVDSVMRRRTPPPPPIGTVGIVTRDRADSLERAVRSLVENRQTSGKSLELVIVDRSDPVQGQAVIAALQGLHSKLGTNVRYACESDVALYAKRLADASGVPPAIVEFALSGDPSCGVTTGASRNVLLLDSAGQLSLQVDDDAVASLTDPPDSEPGVAFTSNPDPTEFWFFENRESLLQSFHFRNGDVSTLHETMLGKPLSGCVESTGGGTVDLLQGSPLHDDLLLRGGPRVVVTCAGVAGDSGIGSTGYFFVDPASRRRLTRSEEFYRAVVESRQVLRTVRKATVCPGAGFISFNVGLDHRELLPPFMPVMRGSDAIFSTILRQAFPDAAVGFLPQCLLHLPAKPRSQGFDELWSEMTGASFVSVLLLVIGSCPDTLRGQPAADALRRMGSHLVAVASSPLDDFEEFLRTTAWQNACGTLAEVERFLQTPNGNGDFLRSYQRRYLELARQSVPRPEYVVPRDLVAIVGFDRARNVSRELVRRFGELLQSWPALVTAAKSLRAAEVRPGRILSN